MSRVAYLCGDRGIPLPGSKGASHHVVSICRAFIDEGWSGSLHTLRATEEIAGGMPTRPLEPDAVLATRPDLIYERYSLWHEGGIELADRLDVPLLIEVNAPLPDEAQRYRDLADADRARDVARRLFARADGLVCVSDEVAAWTRTLGAPQARTRVVPNGVDPDLFRPQPTRHPELPGPETPVIAFAGSFRPWHGLPHVLDALTLLERDHGIVAHLLCVGDGPAREPLAEAAAAAGVATRVHLPGAVPQQALRDWIGAADVGVAPYPALDAFYFSPLKLYELMALEIPVVAAELGQVAGILDDGRFGIGYRAGSAADLARALAACLSDRAAARARAQDARAWLLDHATWRHRLREILAPFS